MENETILVIEHDLLTANLIARKLLPALGYNARVAIDGKSAVWSVNSQQIALVLLDLDLPDMDPMEVLRHIHAEDPHIPTILLASQDAGKLDIDVLHRGVQGYLQKPLNVAKLSAAISRALAPRRLQAEKASLTQQFSEQVSWMQTLTKIGQSVTSILELDEVLRRIVEAGVDLTGAEEGFLALLEENNDQLYLRAAKNLDADKTKTMRLPIHDSLIGQVIQSGKPLRISQGEEQPALKLATGLLVQNLLHVPLISRGKVLGVLTVDQKFNKGAFIQAEKPLSKQGFTEMDEVQLTSLADYAAVAIENASLYQHAQQEIQERIQAEEKLLHDALHDALTDLPNRALFMDRLRRGLEHVKRHKETIIAVLFLDLDRFKNVNDSLGHSKGDELLIAAAKVLQETVRPSDTVARLGGDEFVILLEDIQDISDASRIAERIQEKLGSISPWLDQGVFITTSIGIVLSASGYQNPEDMLRDADIAMYRAKALGKARYEIFDPAMRERILERMRVEAGLRMALEKGDLRVYYQPILSLDNLRIAGFEALVRWQHPELGLLLPGAFISVAEETGLITAIDDFVLKEACRQTRAWQQELSSEKPLQISVNLSGKHVSHPDLFENITQTLEETGLEASHLKLEITENAIMENRQSTVELFERLQALGVHIQIDDFGVGYSSLSYLSDFPVHALKIDQSFVRKLSEGENPKKIIQSISMLANGLNMEVVAEGVETEEQFNALHNLGCEYAQGAYISMPVDAEAAFDFLRRYPALPIREKIHEKSLVVT